MTYRSSVLALPNLVAFWPCDETVGATTLVDVGPNTIPLTVQTARSGGAPVLGSAPLVPEFSGSLSIPGPVGSVAVTAAAGVGSALRATGAVSLFGWAKVTTASITSGTGLLGGRNSNWYMRYLPSGQVTGAVTLAGVGKGVSGRTNFTLGQTNFWTITYDPTLAEVELWCNAVRFGRAYATGGSITATSDTFSLAESGGNAMVGQIQGVGIVSRRLDPGEQRLLIAAAGVSGAQRPEFSAVDYAADGVAPVVVNAPAGDACSGCGGLMRSTEPRVRRGGRVAHLGCYSLQLKPAARKVTTSDTKSQLMNEVGRVMFDFVTSTLLRPSSDKTFYWDGVKFIGPTVDPTWWRVQIGVGEASALLARWKRLPASAWLVRLAAANVDRALTAQTASGALLSLDDGTTLDVHFGMLQMCTTALALKPLVSAVKFTSWRAKLVETARYMYLSSGANSYAPESGYYTNGNFELMETLIYWLVWKLTGDTYWQVAFEAAWTFAISPPQTGRNVGFGLQTVVTPTLPDWSDGKGYMAELGSTTPGLDWDYLGVQAGIASRAWLLSGDTRWLKLINIFRNQMRDRVNATTWIYDATGGTRHSLTDGYRSEAELILWRAGRSDVALTGTGGVLDQFTNKVEPDWRNFSTNYNISAYVIGRHLGNWVMCADDFPALT